MCLRVLVRVQRAVQRHADAGLLHGMWFHLLSELRRRLRKLAGRGSHHAVTAGTDSAVVGCPSCA